MTAISVNAEISSFYRERLINQITTATSGEVLYSEQNEAGRATQIRVPSYYTNLKIARELRNIMKDLERDYLPVQPWTALGDGAMLSFNVAKDNSGNVLNILYLPDNHDIIIHESIIQNEPEITIPNSFFEKLKNFIEWGSVIETGGFIKDSFENTECFYTLIQLQDYANSHTICGLLSPIYTYLKLRSSMNEDWHFEDGNESCSFYIELNKYICCNIYIDYILSTNSLALTFEKPKGINH